MRIRAKLFLAIAMSSIGLTACKFETTSTSQPHFNETHPRAIQFIKPGHVVVALAYTKSDAEKFGPYYPVTYDLRLKPGHSKTYESEHFDNVLFLKADWQKRYPDELQECLQKASRRYDVTKSNLLIQFTSKKSGRTYYLMAAPENRRTPSQGYEIRMATYDKEVLPVKDIRLDEFCFTYLEGGQWPNLRKWAQKYAGFSTDIDLRSLSVIPKERALQQVSKATAAAEAKKKADAISEARLVKRAGIHPRLVANATARYVRDRCNNFDRLYDTSQAKAGGYAIIGAGLANFRTRGNACIASFTVGWRYEFTHQLGSVSDVRCQGSERDKKCKFTVNLLCRYESSDTSAVGARHYQITFGNMCRLAQLPTPVEGRLQKVSNDKWRIVGRLKVVRR